MDRTMSKTLERTGRSKLRRNHDRGFFDRDTIDAILAAEPMCSVGYVIDGKPFVTPTLQWREGDHVYWHGSSASRALRKSAGTEVCLTVTMLDGFVLARSAFHHSVNFRSVMLFGRAELVPDEEKEARLTALIECLYPGGAASLRPNKHQEYKATTILRMPITEGSAKVRTGQPVDDEEDYGLPIWAGVIPIERRKGEPIPDPRNMDGVEPPEHVRNFVWPR